MNVKDRIIYLCDRAQQNLANKQLQLALNNYRQALQIAQDNKLTRLTAVILNYIGDIWLLLGEIQDSVIAYEAAIQVFNSEEESQLAEVINRLSSVSKGFYGDVDFAPVLDRAENAPTIVAEANDPALPIKLLLDIGNAYLNKLQVEPAFNAYQQAFNYPEIESNLILKAYVLTNLGEIYRRQDNLVLAEDKIKQALELFERENKPLQKRNSLAILAKIYSDRGLIIEAIENYEKSLELYEKAKDNRGKARTLTALGKLYLDRPSYEKAQSVYTEALAIADRENDRENIGYSHFGLGCCYQEAGELDKAIASFQEFLDLVDFKQQDLLTDEGKVTFLDSIKDVFDRLIIAYLDLAQKDPKYYAKALDIAEKSRGRALNDLLGVSQRRHPQEKLYAAALLQDDILNTPVQAAPANPQYPSVVIANRDIVKVPPLARLVFYVLEDRTAIFVVDESSEIYGHTCSVNCHQWEEKVAQLRQAMQVDEASRGLNRKLIPLDIDRGTSDLDETELLQEFYQELIAPIVNYLPAKDNTIVIEPHASLWLVPFAALQLSDSSYFGDRYSLIYTPSIQTLEEIRAQKPYAPIEQSKFLIVGNPVMPQVPTEDNQVINLDPLSGAQEEVDVIAELLTHQPYTLLTKAEATEVAVKKLAFSHNVIHLATHGIAYTNNPLNSFIAFAPTDNGSNEGLLTAKEIATRRQLPVDLVVLSACQTGLGRVSGDGIIGLSRACLIAGARTVIVSQWSVSDSATKELMVAFYQDYLQSGNKAVALKKAMSKVRNISQFSQPRYWSAFTLIGSET
ncbi:MAG: CHAT domain-containing tetratricopeptide repeat protein [Cyanobacteria bacterium P01_G01_bin.39]